MYFNDALPLMTVSKHEQVHVLLFTSGLSGTQICLYITPKNHVKQNKPKQHKQQKQEKEKRRRNRKTNKKDNTKSILPA